MKLKELASAFNRAAAGIFSIQKFAFLFLGLILAGLFFLFFQSFSFYANVWVKFLLAALPLFLLIPILTVVGCLVMKIYSQEREGKTVQIGENFLFLKPRILKGLAFALIVPASFILLWILIGLLILLKAIPYLGPFLGVIFAFAPFLLNLAALLLFFASLFTLFFFAPLFILNDKIDRKALVKRLNADLFTHLGFVAVAWSPLWIVWFFVSKALWLTFAVYASGDGIAEKGLQSLFMLIPFAAILALPLIFFFNFSWETYLMTVGGSEPQKEDAADHS